MTLAGPDERESLLVLTEEELHLLRFTCDLYAAEESPFGLQVAADDGGLLERAAKSLIARRLAEPGTFRPERELLRRLLIVGQPDARVILSRVGARQTERLLDVYERAGAFVPYRRIADGHELSAPLELEDLLEQIRAEFRPRDVRGDFLDLRLAPAEYFAFSLLAGDLHARRHARRGMPIRAPRAPSAPATARNILGGREGPEAPISESFADEGTPLEGMLRRLPSEIRGAPHVPGEAEWAEALEALLDSSIISKHGDRFALRPYLHDLALALAAQRRHVLTRFDYGGEDWFVRDATLLSVPGSLFLLRTLPDAAMRIVELDHDALASCLRYVLAPLASDAEEPAP